MLALFYDLDGARSSGQWEVAWRARDCMLGSAVRLHLRDRNVTQPEPSGLVPRTDAALRTLEEVNPGLAAEAWELVSEEAPADSADLDWRIDATLDFIRDQLGVAYTREQAVRTWADGVRMLRGVASSIGLAQTDGWYVSEASEPSSTTDWYDEITRNLDQEAGR